MCKQIEQDANIEEKIEDMKKKYFGKIRDLNLKRKIWKL